MTDNNIVELKVKIIDDNATLPVKMYDNDVGFDLSSSVDMTLNYGEISIISTGISLEIPNGYEVQIRPRSGHAVEYGMTLVNSPGTIDPGYRDEIKIISTLLKKDTSMVINKGDRIAQAVLKKVPNVVFNVVDELEDSSRGLNGLGSTGS